MHEIWIQFNHLKTEEKEQVKVFTLTDTNITWEWRGFWITNSNTRFSICIQIINNFKYFAINVIIHKFLPKIDTINRIKGLFIVNKGTV